MNNATIVLPSARAIRHEQFLIDAQTLFLPNFITMGEFISKLCVVDGLKIVDDDSRVLLLLEASNFAAFSSLQIQRNFFTFTKNSSYIFKFFEELAQEMYDINGLDTSDIYGEYEEHIAILKELYLRYEALCQEKKVLDKIFLPKLYHFNETYLKQHQEITIYVDGHLTNFELELLQKAAQFCKLDIVFETSRFNIKMQKRLAELGLELETGHRYTISLNEMKIYSIEKREINKNITCESFSESILQVAFVKQKVYEFIEKGYKPENIGVILPDENMAKLLHSFDTQSNFNFAMGESYTDTPIYQQLYATSQALEQKSQENFARLGRFGDELYLELLSIYHKELNEVDVIAILENYKTKFSDKTHLKIFDEEIYSFQKLMSFLQGMKVKAVIALFLQRLANRTLDDVRGGKVTVMGVLETRSVEFDAVVIVDFSDSHVPKRSDKDMFLNTSIREIANLPTMNDRENLQKHYYELLISRSKEVAISYVNSSDSVPSRFLKQLGIKEENKHDENEYANILFKVAAPKEREERRIIMPYSFQGKKISATSLKTFLTCKRKYYHKYIENIYGHEIPKDVPQEYEIGNSVHLALNNLYSKQNTYADIEVLKKDLHKELHDVEGNSELDKYLIAMQKKRLDTFCETEIERFSDGWKVFGCEESFEVNFAGATLVGQIDRIDKRENEIYVLDYKTGSYPIYNKNNFTEATDFQLEFYHLLSSGLGNVIGCAYYDLKEGKIVEETFLNEKLSVLESNIKDLLALEEIDFEKTQDVNNCSFCDYKLMCGRE